MRNLLKSLRVLGMSNLIMNISSIVMLLALQVDTALMHKGSLLNEKLNSIISESFVLLILLMIVCCMLTIVNILYYMSKWCIENKKFKGAKVMMFIDSLIIILVSYRVLVTFTNAGTYEIIEKSTPIVCVTMAILSIMSIIYNAISRQKI